MTQSHDNAQSADTGRQSDRREFLTQCSALAASGFLAAGAAGAAGAAEAPPAPLPTIALGQYRVTRLVAGSNPLSGYSYLGDEMDREMRAYFTPERIIAFLRQCEQAGINTHQFSAASKALDTYRALREQGSKMHLIGLHAKREDIKPMAEAARPIAMVHHGGVTDTLFREKRQGEVRDFVKAVHDQGMLAGVSAHNPDCIRRIADEGWEVDFFMTCFYYLTRPQPPEAPAPDSPVLEGPVVHYTFYKNDPAAMCKVIRQVKQPCLAFKILGGGRRCATQDAVREAFRFAFENIKPTDGIIVGMYPRRLDQASLNAEYARQAGRAS